MIKRTSAVVAVTAFGVVMGAGSALAADGIPCGTPAADAVYRTVVTPAVPAVTHVEQQWALWETPTVYQWQRWVVDVPGQEAVYRVIHHPATYETVVISPAREAWDEQVLVTAAWTEEVLVREAVYVTEYEFVHRNGNTRWEDSPTWNIESNGQSDGWTRTASEPRQTVVSEAVYDTVEHEAVYETIHHPAVDAVTEQREVTAAWESGSWSPMRSRRRATGSPGGARPSRPATGGSRPVRLDRASPRWSTNGGPSSRPARPGRRPGSTARWSTSRRHRRPRRRSW